MAMYYVLMFIGIAFGFGEVFYWQNALTPFFALIFVLGLGGANFALFTLWIPEQFTTECRGSAIGFTSSVGRFVGVAMVFLVGAGISSGWIARRPGCADGGRVHRRPVRAARGTGNPRQAAP